MPDDAGGSGGDCVPNTRDTRMQARAIRERWPMSESVRVKVLKRMVAIVDEDTVHDPLPPPGHREVISAAKALLAADKLNLEHMKFEHDTRPAERPDDDFMVDISADDPA